MKKFEKDIAVSDFIPKYVDVEKFLGFCKQCPFYAKSWSCQPYDFDPMDVWHSYKTLKVIACQFEPKPGMDKDACLKYLTEVKNDLLEYTYALEKKYPGSRALAAGVCQWCEPRTCARATGEPCRYPHLMRYSIESLGGDVVGVINELMGLQLKWTDDETPPEYFIMCGGLLMK